MHSGQLSNAPHSVGFVKRPLVPQVTGTLGAFRGASKNTKPGGHSKLMIVPTSTAGFKSCGYQKIIKIKSIALQYFFIGYLLSSVFYYKRYVKTAKVILMFEQTLKYIKIMTFNHTFHYSLPS